MAKLYDYKQERVLNHSLSERLAKLQSEGWEYVEIIERVEPPRYRDGGIAGPGRTVVLLRKQKA